MKLKIISDGTTNGTHLIDIATGEKVQYVQNIEWEADAKLGTTSATIKILMPAAEITTPAKIISSAVWNEGPDFEEQIASTEEKSINIISDGLVGNTVISNSDAKPISAVQKNVWKVDVNDENTEAFIDRIDFD